MQKNKLQEIAQRYTELETERQSWEEDWKTLAGYFLPRKCRFLEAGDKTNEGGLRRGSLDSTGVYAMRDLAAGLQGGVTSPARQWFKLSLRDPALDRRSDVRAWLDKAEQYEREVLHRSNFYNAVHHIYSELGTFGTAFMFALPDERTVVRYSPLTAGEYCLDTNELGIVDTVFRHMDMTLRQLVRRFGLENLPEALRKMWEKTSQWNARFRVVHAVYPRNDRDPGKIDAKNKPFASIYYLDGYGGGNGLGGNGLGGSGHGEYPYLLRESGFDEFPGFGVRWDVTGNDVYGRSPGMDVLPDCVLLHSMTASMLKALHKQVDPPMVAPAQLKNINLLPGGANFIDAGSGQGQQVYPAMQIRPDIQGAMAAVGQIQNKVREGLFNDLFRMLLNSDRRQITAREIAAREEEKMLLIGPVLERLHDELLTPLISRTFSLMAGAGFLPPPPEDVAGADMKVEFVSVLAQAQKLVGTGAIEQFAGFVGQGAQIYPEMLDVVDSDKLADTYADYLGVPAEIIRGQDERDRIREARAEAQQQQEQMMAAQMAMQGGQG